MLKIAKRPERKSKYELYLRAFQKIAKESSNDSVQGIGPYLKRIVFYGVMTINSMSEQSIEDAESNFELGCCVKSLMGLLTPIEFMQLFPITKDFKGHKWQSKDYFYTRDYINTLEQDKPIGDKIMHFMWEYMNWDVTAFNVNLMCFMSDIRRLQGEPGIMEELAEKNGIKTYTMHTDDKGKQYLQDNETGRTTRVRKPKPRYLKVVR